MLRMTCLAAMTAALLTVAAPASARCMKPDEVGVAQGRLTLGKFKDATDRPETAYILRLSAPACLDATKDDEPVAATRTIHVYSSSEAIQKKMRRLVGKAVLVRGKPFAQHTAHHRAPIVMDASEIAVR